MREVRAEWGWTRLEQAGQDVRYAVRSLRKHPGFTATAVLSLALGIGANTALFTLINTVSWKMLPVKDPEHLLVLGQQDPTSVSNGFTYQQYQTIRDHNHVMDLAAYSRVPLNVSLDGSTEPTVEGQLVSGNYFSLLGVRSGRGRLFGLDDDRVPSGHPVAVISDGYWKSRFARDPEIVGRPLSLSVAPFTIVGVTPPEFFGVEVGTAPKVFVPVMMQPIVMPVSENLLDHPGLYSTWLRAVGRVDLRPDSPFGVIVNEAFVREILSGQDPFGQHGVTRMTRRSTQGVSQREPVTILGVVRDSRYPALREATPPIMYQTFLQTSTGRGQMVLHVRTAGNPGEIARQVRSAVQAIDKDVPMFEVHTLADEVDAALVRERLIATLSSAFGVVALVLVCIGLYGLMAFTVSRRTAEIGIRIALGATRSDVGGLIARQALRLVLAGIAVGIPAAWIVGHLAWRQLSGILFELTPADPVTLTAATILLGLVAMCAGVLPARRAARIDPIVALRNE